VTKLPWIALRLALPLALSANPTLGAAQALIWNNGWTVQAPPALQHNIYSSSELQLQAPVSISPDGEVVIREASQSTLDDQFVRFSSTGAVRWRVNLGNEGSTWDPVQGAMVANPDGSAFVATQEGAALARIESNGTITWSDSIDTVFLASASTQVVEVQGCNSVVALDALLGQSLWEYSFANSTGQCAASGLMTDATGNAYAEFSVTLVASNPMMSEVHLLKFDPNGKMLWEQVQLTPNSVQLVGLGATRVYLNLDAGYSQLSVQALSTGDGSVAWTSNGAAGLGMAGTPAELFVSSSAGVQRLASSDGSPRWTQAVFNSGTSSTVSAFSGFSDYAIVGASQVDANTGTVNWTAALPTADASGNYLFYIASGLLADGSIVFAASPIAGAAPPVFQRVNSASGALRGQIPVESGAQGILAESIVADPQTIAATVPVWTQAGLALRLRALNSSDGSLRWETVDDSLQATGFNGAPYFGIVGANDALAVAIGGTLGNTGGAAWVGAYDMSTGAQRWTQFFDDFLDMQGPTVLSDPIADTDGNVIAAYATTITYPHGYPPTPPMPQGQLSIVKLSAVDGSLLWRHDDILPQIQDQTMPQSISMLGSDVLVWGGPFAAPYATSSMLRLSGKDGSVVWSSNVFYTVYHDYGSVFGAYPVGDGTIVVTGEGGWASVDAQTGATIWSNAQPAVCVGNCQSGGGTTVLPDGDLVSVGQNNSTVQIAVLPGTANATPVYWSPDQADRNLTQSFGYTVNVDSSGNVWTRIARHYLYDAEIAYLAKVDPTTGSLTSQQAMFTTSRDPLLQSLSPIPLAAPEANSMMAVSYNNDPTAPETSGDSLIDTTITANGNLSIQFITDRASAAPGQLVAFQLTAMYSGDAPIAGAKLIADFPWVGHAVGLTCVTQSASNCVIDVRADTIVATFDMQPGGSIELTGQIRDTGGNDPAVLAAIVAGPMGLNELNTLDNSVRTNVNQSLFANGFESTP
jgi:hypothetical protein